jgi:drug/metabolite transporter (DMT)-like permease
MHADTAVIAFWRMWIGAAVTLLLARRAARLPTARELRRSAVAGVLFATSLIAGWQSIKETSVANAQLIPALQPVLVLLVAGRLFGERIGRTALGFAGAGIVGVVVFVLGAGGSGGASARGDLWAVGNLVVWTLYFLELKRQRERGIDTLPYLAGILVTGSLALTPYVLVVERGVPPLHGWEWLGALSVVLVPGLAGHGLMTYAQRHVDVTVLSLLTLASPVISAAGAWLIYDQGLAAAQLAAGLVVLASLAGLVVDHQRGVRARLRRAEPLGAARPALLE